MSSLRLKLSRYPGQQFGQTLRRFTAAADRPNCVNCPNLVASITIIYFIPEFLYFGFCAPSWR